MNIRENLRNPRSLNEIWESDHLDRKAEAAQFSRFLDLQYKQLCKQDWRTSYVIAVQGPYGLGKTVFLKALAEALAHNHPVSWVDAWLDDGLDDPLTSITMGLSDSIKRFASSHEDHAKLKTVQSASARVGKAVVRGVITKGISLIVDADAASDITKMVLEGANAGVEEIADAAIERDRKAYEERHAAIGDLKSSLIAVISELDKSTSFHPPIYVFIDELDRCRPPYAIKLLETIKHLFDVPGIIFIFGVEMRQLQATVKGLYGSEFDGSAYLRRFINRNYSLREPALDKLCLHLINQFDLNASIYSVPPRNAQGEQHLMAVAVHISDWLGYFSVTAREAIRVFDMIKTFEINWPHNSKIELVLLIPMVIQLLSDVEDWAGKVPKTSRRMPTAKFPRGDVSFEQLQHGLIRRLDSPYSSVLEQSPGADDIAQWIWARLKEEIDHRSQPCSLGDLPLLKSYAERLRFVSRLVD